MFQCRAVRHEHLDHVRRRDGSIAETGGSALRQRLETV
jgi:hypothetical protein